MSTIQTAAQINLPQTGQLTVTPNPNIPKPHKLISPVKPEPKTKEGWWSVNDKSGSLQGVSDFVEAQPEIPRHWKDAIKADMAARCGTDFNFVYLDAHYFNEKGNAVLHYHCQPDKKLL